MDADGWPTRQMASADPSTIARFAAALPRSAEAAVASSLVVNPLSFSRNVVVRRPEIAGAAAAEEARSAMVELPALGFAWVDWTAPAPRRDRREQPMAEGLVLRNEFFELADRSDHRRHSALVRLPSPLESSFATDRAAHAGRRRLGEPDGTKSGRTGDLFGDASRGDRNHRIGSPLGRNHQSRTTRGCRTAVDWLASSSALRVERGSRLVHLAIELDPVEEPSADPWHAYFAARFAWDSAAADLWRGVHGGRHPTVAQQIEAPEYIEIDSPAGRTAIITAGLPFHRRSGPRILDSLLIVRGETARQFRLAIGVDVPNPTAAAAECLTPAVELHEVARPLAGGAPGLVVPYRRPDRAGYPLAGPGPRPRWSFAMSAGGPGELRGRPRQAVPPQPAEGRSGFASDCSRPDGQSVRVRLRTCRTVTEATEGRLPRSEPRRPVHRARLHFLRPGWPRMGRDRSFLVKCFSPGYARRLIIIL